MARTIKLKDLALPGSVSLDAERREAVIADLNAHLAHLTDLALSAKQAHWNVHALNFEGLHELYDQVVTAARDYSDDVAERAVQLGGQAIGTLQSAASATTLPAFPVDERDWEPLTSELHNRIVAVTDRLRKSADSLDDEKATQDLYIEIIRGLEKWAWMLRAHVTSE